MNYAIPFKALVMFTDPPKDPDLDVRIVAATLPGRFVATKVYSHGPLLKYFGEQTPYFFWGRHAFSRKTEDGFEKISDADFYEMVCACKYAALVGVCMLVRSHASSQ